MAAVRGGGNNDDGADKSAFRCLDAARYVVSAVVVVLIVAVAARATMVVLRPEALFLSVPRSSVFVDRSSSSAAEGTGKDDLLKFQFTLHAQNPSGRASMYFYNISANLFDNITTAMESTSPCDDSLICFTVNKDMMVPQMDFVDDTVIAPDVPRDGIMVSFFDRINRGARIDNATMRVDGTLVSEIIRSGYNTTPKLTTYYCRNIIVGLNTAGQASMSSQATCTQ